jgi:hypothetical protein
MFSIYPSGYLNYVGTLTMIISCLTTVIWYLLINRIYSNQIKGLHKIITSLPYIKSFLSILIFYYIEISNEDEKTKDNLMNVYLDTLSTTLMSIFKTIMWFILILIASVFCNNIRDGKFIRIHFQGTK